MSSVNNFLDPNFYNTIPIWIYFVSGLGILNITFICCCYCCKNKKNESKLKIRELELDRRELELDKRYELERREKEMERRRKARDKEYEGITLSKPTLYSEMA